MIKVDTKDLENLAKGLSRFKEIMPNSVANQALRKSVAPMLRATRSEVPVGNIKGGEGYYETGGTTRRDLRIRIVKGVGEESSRAIIGVSKKKGKVGWRTHFITQGTSKMEANPFLERAYNSTIEEVKRIFQGEFVQSFNRWAGRNLPKNWR